MALSQLLYISDAVEPMTPTKLNAIHTTSMRNNAIHGITGILFFSDGQFVQFIEGQADLVRALFQTIRRDPRHESIKLLFDRPTDEREFENCSMALLNLDDFSNCDRNDLVDLVHMAGYQVVDAESDTPMDILILRNFRRDFIEA